MRQRYIVIILSLFIGLGAYAHPAGAGDCAAHITCTPMHGAGGYHPVGGHNDHCNCGLWGTQPVENTCRLEGLLQSFQAAFVPPAFKHPHVSALGLAGVRQDRIPRLDRVGLPQRLNKTDSPYSFPIYLRTLALLC